MQGHGHRVASLPPPSFLRSRREVILPAAGCSRPPHEADQIWGEEEGRWVELGMKRRKGGCVRCVWGRAGHVSS
jgi:hypothetical protein